MFSWLKPLLSLFSSLMQWLQQRQLLDAGRKAQQAEDLTRVVEVKDEQARIEQDKPRNPDEFVKRLRDEGF